MIVPSTLSDGTMSYLVRVGRKPAKAFSEREYGTRKLAKARAKSHEGDLLAGSVVVKSVTCERYADRLLSHLEKERLRNGRERKDSTIDTHRYSAVGFKAKFGKRSLSAPSRSEARDWALEAPAGQVKFAVLLYNRAIEEGLVAVNPFKGLAATSRGRSDLAPPTIEEFDKLLDGWQKHGKYAPMGRAIQTFAGFSGIRPGELFALEWDDVDFDGMRVHIRRRLYDGGLDLPKSNKARRIVLTPQARDALLGLERVARTVFVSKRGKRLSAATFSNYWAVVKAKADLDFDFYLATRHRFVHEAYVVRGLSTNAIAQQLGWSASAVEHLLKVYGHGDLGWEGELDRAYAENVRLIRKVAG